jgi:hypothetical protein
MTRWLRDPYTPPVRWLMFVSGLLVIFACSLLALGVGHHWSWGLFAWGIAAGLLAIACYEAMFRLIVVVSRAPAAEVADASRELKPRRQTLFPLFGAYGLAFGIASAGLASIWPDLFWTALVILSEVVFPLALYPFIKRRIELIKQRSGGAEGAEAR